MDYTPQQLKKLYLRVAITFEDYQSFLSYRRIYITRNFRTRPVFSVDSLSEDDCEKMFRFTKPELKRLYSSLRLQQEYTSPNGTRFSGFEGLLILMRRLCYPNRLCELESIFNRDISTISRISTIVTNVIYSRFGHLVKSLNSHLWLSEECLQRFADIINGTGCAYRNVVGFIDGTARMICRPKYNQQLLYSGYKKQHIMKYQSVMFPNGIIGRLDGPVNGRRHDSAILHLTGLLRELDGKFLKHDGTWFCLYGDLGYANQKFIKTGYKNSALNPLSQQQREFNRDMSSLRVSVEYGFGKIIQLFAFVDFKKNQKMYLQQIKKQYIIAAILTNCHTCLRGSQVTRKFACNPPDLETYLVPRF